MCPDGVQEWQHSAIKKWALKSWALWKPSLVRFCEITLTEPLCKESPISAQVLFRESQLSFTLVPFVQYRFNVENLRAKKTGKKKKRFAKHHSKVIIINFLHTSFQPTCMYVNILEYWNIYDTVHLIYKPFLHFSYIIHWTLEVNLILV